jgi:heavy metal sensor kinase
MNIRLRLTLWYTAILFLILVIFSLAVYIGLTRSLLITTDNHLQREVGEILGNLKFEDADSDEEAEEEDGEEGEEGHEGVAINNTATNIKLTYTPEEGVYWRIVDSASQPLVDPGHFDGASFDPAILKIDHPQFEYATLADNTPIRLYTAPFVLEQQGAGVIQVAENYRHVQEVQRLLISLLVLGIPFILLAASGGGWFLANSALAPIDRITRTAGQISAQDLHQRLNLKLPNDEVGRLATTFDTMLARLENAFEQQKRFIADASHEMRTPLTILKGDVEVALNRPRSAKEYQETLKMVNQTTDRLNALTEELFLLARADNNQYPLQLEPINLPQLLTHEVSSLLPHALKKQVTLHLDTPDELSLPGDPAKLARLFRNLIENAIKYAQANDAVTITVTSVNSQARITIADTGPGIPSEHLAHIFERFYRIDKARSRQTAEVGSGAGLGLSIAQWLAQAHGGRIEVTSEVGQGTTFTVWLPLTPPPS